jgi:UDP-N-acetylglucosamine 2-epimerase
VLDQLGLSPKSYYVATVHRAENTDRRENLASIFEGLDRLDKPVVIPLHPRTLKKLKEFQISLRENVKPLDPLGYLDMLKLQSQASCILTDSGGVQKEAYYLSVPCVTLRYETEWAETVTATWNLICGTESVAIVEGVRRMEGCQAPHPNLYGDGTTAQRIVEILSRDGGKTIQ